MLVYVAGPLSADDLTRRRENLNQAINAGCGVMRIGHTPLVPHLSDYLDRYAKYTLCWDIPYEDWMTCCLEQLEHCDALLYLGSSPGADRELARAMELGMPVYRSIEALENHRPDMVCEPETSE